MFKNLGKELRDFILRGNVMDMAVGIIIGAAFGIIVDSLVKDIIMPPIGWVLGKVDFSNLKLTMADDVTINYGAFLNNVISFIIVAFAVFILIKAINRVQASVAKQEAEKVEATTKICPYCKSEIAIDATRCPHCTSELDAKKK